MQQAMTVYAAAIFLTFNLYLIFMIEGVEAKIAFALVTACTFACAVAMYRLEKGLEKPKKG